MKLTFLGGADEVGASCTLVEMAGKKLLIDAGIRISPRSSRGIDNSQLPDLQPITATGGPDYILVTHAHTDHTGALPLVVERYPHTPVIMTRPTEALTRTLQKDAQRIMKSRYDQEGELPIFDQVAVDALMEAIQIVEFNQPLKLGDGLQVTYHISGHIAGAAMLVLESTEGTLVMSGDVSLSPQRTVENLQVPRIKADALVLESTYGGRLHAERRGEELRLMETLKRVTERGGKVLIPAFALGRAQEVVQIIHAYRDNFDVPVYVDGMVRSVCDSYARFSDLVPDRTTRAAGDDHLFFRDKIKPIRSRQMREEIAASSEPLVVVASSGMLTGGASVAYAKHFAPDERNAILLTGYQDEEAPGRFLQNMMKKRQEGDVPTIKFDDTVVKVRCEVGTYSLSAHADEQELVNVALALKPNEVMLVHGDHGARHSIATALRRRQISVSTPKIGTVKNFAFKSKPWGVGTAVQKGSHAGDVDVARMWESLKGQAGDYFSVRELSQVWWGDSERTEEMKQALAHQDNIYFSADWRNQTTFRVNSEQQVNRSLRQRAIMLANPDIVGKIIVLRNSNNQPRLGLVTGADIDSFDAKVASARGTHYPADALLWIIGPADKPEDFDGGWKSWLSHLMKTAKGFTDVVITFRQRQKLVNEGKAVLPETLIPEVLPEGVDRQTALVSIVLALAADGATLEQDGLKPQRAMEHEPLDQNDARNIALSTFPDEARLRKVGMEIHRKRLILYFDFPQSALRKYDEEIETLIEATGWEVQVRHTVNQQALSEVLAEMLPDGVSIVKGPSYFMDRREVQVELSGIDNTADLEAQFKDITDFKLTASAHQPVQAADLETITIPEDGGKMEINDAYTIIKAELTQYGLYKAGLKQGRIVLSFISPQVGERHIDTINALAKKTGYNLSIHPHPNQHQILSVARQLLSDWSISKGPGIHVDRAALSVKPGTMPDDEEIERVQKQLEDKTGYTLEISG